MAYFGRPADPAGLNFWVDVAIASGGDLSSIAEGFSRSAEAKTLYALSNSTGLVTAIYENQFGRLPENQGLQYWVGEVDKGAINPGVLALAIANSALGRDRITLEQRLEAAKCMIPDFDGAIFSLDWKDALWARFYTGAPPRQRRSVERYSIVKRA